MSSVPEPDTKNWTWVLKRPCDECGLDVARLPREATAPLVSSNAAAWQDVLRGETVRERPSPGVWSPLEYACHVRDVFRLFDDRLRLMLEQDDPLFANWDQDAAAVAERYGEQDPAVVAVDVQAAGDTVSASFAAVSADQWGRTGRRSDGSAFSVESFGRYFIHDPVHHLWDVTRRRAIA